VALAKRLLRASVKSVATVQSCGCQAALQNAIVTAPEVIPAALQRKLAVLTDRMRSPVKGKR
jgi:hypothetical protein